MDQDKKKYHRVDINQLQKLLPKENLIRIYAQHTAKWICDEYNITKHELDKLLDLYNIERHSPKENNILSWKENPTQGTTNSIYYNNGVNQIRVKPGASVPDGYEEGALKFTKDQTELMLQRRGNRSPMQTETGKENFKKSMLNKYGIDNPMKLRDVFLKVNKGNKSKAEDAYYEFLVNKYGKNDVIRNYKEERYPFFCDFYIPSQDLFIECNYHWTHGGRPFNPDDDDCLNQLVKWEDEANEKDSRYMRQAIYIWTELDPKKREVAKNNNLNYIEIFN